MKQAKWKRALALVMVLMMCLSLFPSASATEVDTPDLCANGHSYENGVCTICHLAHTEHTYENGECTICHLAHTEHTYENGECTVCHLAHTEHAYEGGFCTVCQLAEPVAPVVPAAPAAEQKVTLRFVRTPENASVTVYTLADGEYTVVEPEEDGSWSLLPGSYFYDASCEGYVALKKVALTVAAEDGSFEQTERVKLYCVEHSYGEGDICTVCGLAKPAPVEQRVSLNFDCTPADAEVKVYTLADEEHTVVEPEEDGSYSLLPGSYFYDASCEGYAALEEFGLTVALPEDGSLAQTETVKLYCAEHAEYDEDGYCTVCGAKPVLMKSGGSRNSANTTTVIFKVVNGAWNDGTTADKTFEVEDKDNGSPPTTSDLLALLPSNPPTAGERPNAGYLAAGWWDNLWARELSHINNSWLYPSQTYTYTFTYYKETVKTVLYDAGLQHNGVDLYEAWNNYYGMTRQNYANNFESSSSPLHWPNQVAGAIGDTPVDVPVWGDGEASAITFPSLQLQNEEKNYIAVCSSLPGQGANDSQEMRDSYDELFSMATKAINNDGLPAERVGDGHGFVNAYQLGEDVELTGMTIYETACDTADSHTFAVAAAPSLSTPYGPFVFKGWTDGTTAFNPGDALTVKANVPRVLGAVWNPALTYDLNLPEGKTAEDVTGMTAVTENYTPAITTATTVTVEHPEYSGTLPLPELSMDGYTFKGWAVKDLEQDAILEPWKEPTGYNSPGNFIKQDDGSYLWSPESYMSQTVYAVWEGPATTKTLLYDVNLAWDGAQYSPWFARPGLLRQDYARNEDGEVRINLANIETILNDTPDYIPVWSDSADNVLTIPHLQGTKANKDYIHDFFTFYSDEYSYGTSHVDMNGYNKTWAETWKYNLDALYEKTGYDFHAYQLGEDVVLSNVPEPEYYIDGDETHTFTLSSLTPTLDTPYGPYVFKGWHTGNFCLEVNGNQLTVAANAPGLVRAIWFPTLTYDLNLPSGKSASDVTGMAAVTENYTVASSTGTTWVVEGLGENYSEDDGALNLPLPELSMEGYTFKGWAIKDIETGTLLDPWENYSYEPDSIFLGDDGSYYYNSFAWQTKNLSQTVYAVWEESAPTGPYAKLVFKVRNGAWNDGTTADKTEICDLSYDSDNHRYYLPSSIPVPEAGGMPAAGYMAAGWWDDVPSRHDESVESGTTFTFTFTYYQKTVKAVLYDIDPVNTLELRDAWMNRYGMLRQDYADRDDFRFYLREVEDVLLDTPEYVPVWGDGETTFTHPVLQGTGEHKDYIALQHLKEHIWSNDVSSNPWDINAQETKYMLDAYCGPRASDYDYTNVHAYQLGEDIMLTNVPAAEYLYDNTAAHTFTIADGPTLTSPYGPYVFKGWKVPASNYDLEYEPGETVSVEGNSARVLRAVWNPTLTYDLNLPNGKTAADVTGMAEVTEADEYTVVDTTASTWIVEGGEEVKLPLPELSMEGYTFKGWAIKDLETDTMLAPYTNYEYEEYDNSDGFVDWVDDSEYYWDFSRDHCLSQTVYAIWEEEAAGPASYSVEHYVELLTGGFERRTTETLSGQQGTTATANPINIPGYVYDPDNASNVKSGTITADGGLVLKLYYNLRLFTVSYKDGVGQTVFADEVYSNQKYGANTPAFTGSYLREGYAFRGWDPAISATVSQDAVYTAQWLAYTVTADDHWTKGSGENLDVAVASEPADPELRDRFAGVAVDGTPLTADQYTIDPDTLEIHILPAYLETLSAGDHTVTVNFTDDSEASATFTVVGLTATADDRWTKGSDENLDVTVTSDPADPNLRSRFESVEVDGTALTADQHTIDANTLEIHILPAYLETLTPGEHEVTVNLTGGDEASDTFNVVELTATADDHWTKGSNDNLDVTVTSDPADPDLRDRFESVEVDGTVLTPDQYTIDANTLEIHILPAYLETLTPGEHEVTVNLTGGDEVSTTFDVIQLTVTADDHWTSGSEDTLDVTVTSSPVGPDLRDRFESVEVDGTVLTADQYTIDANTLEIHILPAYLETLTPGEHEVTVNLTGGDEASDTFNVVELTATADDHWTKGSNENLDVAVTSEPADPNLRDRFESVEVDGVELTADQYTIDANTLEIHILPAYLETLTPGEHEVTVNLTGGDETSDTFNVVELTATADDRWTKGSDENLDVAVTSEPADPNLRSRFAGVAVDGTALNDTQYTLDPDTLTVHLLPAYLETLGSGEHTVTVTLTDGGTAADSFTVAQLTATADDHWTKGSDDSFDVTVTSDPADPNLRDRFDSVEVDGVELTADQYTIDPNTLEIHILPAYLETLSAGEHTVTVTLTDGGKAEADFTVVGLTATADDHWTKGSDENLDVTVTSEPADPNLRSRFESVEVDGTALTADQYTIDPNTLEIHILPAYLETLTPGEHEVTVNLTGGDTAEAEFTVVALTATADDRWTKGSDENLDVAVTSDPADPNLRDRFAGVAVDGTALNDTQYTLDPDTLTVHLLPAYLETLGSGEHTVTVTLTDGGTAADSFTVAQLTATADDHWTKGSDDSFDVTVTSDPADPNLRSRFDSVEVDGVELTADQYTIDPNTLEIHILPAYLETLSAGDHTVTVNFTDDSEASATFTVVGLTATADDRWTKGSDENLDVTVTSEPADPNLRSRFESVEVDGTALTADQYTIDANTLEIHILPAYLETLSAGEHTVTVNLTGGDTAEAEFTVVALTATADDRWTKGSDENLDVAVTSDPADPNLRDRFAGVAVDGTALNNTQYTLDPDTLTVHLLPAYLETLGSGEHSVTVTLTDGGTAADSFTVAQLTATADDSWISGSGETLDVTVTSNPVDPNLRDRFESVEVDGTTLSANQYTIDPNTLEIHILPAYLETLSAGEHTVTVNFTDGGAAEAAFNETKFTVTMDDTWVKKSGENLDVTVTASPDNTHTRERFDSVEVDGTPLTAGQYTIEPNTLEIHLLPAYLETLALGEHTVTVNFTDGGAAEASFNVATLTYAFTEGAGGTWVKDSGNNLNLTVTASPDNTHTRERFGSVEVDGVALTPDQYEIEPDTMRIHLLPAYLETLAFGKHDITVNFTDDGVAKTSFYVSPLTYNYVEGTGENWTKGSGVCADFVVKAFPDDSQTFARFVDIAVDGTIVSKANYTYEKGSVKQHLLPAYLETLALGQHTLTSYFSDGGVAVTTFTVLPVGAQVSPKTGDMQDHMRVTTIAILAFLGLSASVVYVGERKKNKRTR